VGDQAQFQYLDIGVDIDVRDAIEDAGKLNLSVVSNASSLAGSAVAPRAPIVRQNKWDSKVSVPIGKPTVIFSSDNLEDKGKIQLELTATPEK
jgi:type II secretory pathway component GspD/PulD (secretin)